MGLGRLIRTKQIVCRSLVFAGLAVLAIAQTAFATPAVGVEGTSLAVGTFDGIEARSVTDSHEVELRATGSTDVPSCRTRSLQAAPSAGIRIPDRASSSSTVAC